MQTSDTPKEECPNVQTAACTNINWTEDSSVSDKSPAGQANYATGALPTTLGSTASTSGPVRTQVSTNGQTSVQQAALFTTTGTTALQSNVSTMVQRMVTVGPETTSSSVLVVAKLPTPGVCSTGQPSSFTRPPPAQRVKTPVLGRTVVIAVPRTAVPQPLAPRPPQTCSPQLPANFQIPPGMVLIRSDSGQLMLVSQQTLAQAQAQQAQKAASVPAPRLPAPKVTTVAAPAAKKPDKIMVIKVAAPPSIHAAALQKTTVVNRDAPKSAVDQPRNNVIGQGAQPPTQLGIKEVAALKEPTFTITQETLENVKKCKNFLVTLIKLTSSGSQAPAMTSNVKALVRALLDGSLEPEEFTNKLYIQLKSTPQPYLVPFLKKSLPAVRYLTTDPQHFIQQAGQPKPPQAQTSLHTPGSVSTTTTSDRTPDPNTEGRQMVKYARGDVRSAVTVRLPTDMSEVKRTTPRGMVILSGQQHSGMFSFKRPQVQHQPPSTSYVFKESSYREDDDINDVASMAGVNLREENLRNMSNGGAAVGSVVQSCHDTPFLSSNMLHTRILHTGSLTKPARKSLEVTEVRPEVVALVSHATQEFLRDLLGKLTMVAEHRRIALKEDVRHSQVSDVRSQLHFLEQLELLKKRRRDEEERETLLRLARRRSHSEDPQQQQLRQRAKEEDATKTFLNHLQQLQQVEQAQLQHREANLTALAAIGPRKKRPLDSTGNSVLVARGGIQRVTRVTMRDLVLCMEEERHMRRSLTLYKALMK